MEKRVKEYLEKKYNRPAEFFEKQYDELFVFFDDEQTKEEFVSEQLEFQAKANEERKRINDIRESGNCTNCYGEKNSYLVRVTTGNRFKKYISWAFSIQKPTKEEFTVDYAKELLNMANKEFYKGCPESYYQGTYNDYSLENNPFTKIEVDMSDYFQNPPFALQLIGEEIICYYDIKKDLLQIRVNNNLIYEECNGIENTSF